MAGWGGQEQRWSPFPVQDWSRLPHDPLDSPAYDPQLDAEDGKTLLVDPAWGPPTPRPRGWIPLLVVVLCCLLVGGSLWVVDRGQAPRATAALAFVPVDGHVAYEQRTEDSATGGGETSVVVSESARIDGAAVIGSVDNALGRQVLGVLGLEGVQAGRFWRTTATLVDGIGSGHQDVRVLRVDDAVAVVAESDAGGAFVYDPALVELPADVAAGARWSSSGSAGSAQDYRSDFEATAAADGCLAVRGTVSYASKSRQPGNVRRLTRTWCPGQGMTAATDQVGQRVLAWSQIDGLPGPIEPRTVEEPYAWSDPAAWQRRQYGAISSDPTFGDAAVGSPEASVKPVIAASGLVIRVAVQAQDLIAFTPKTTTDWIALWRMHPGGTVLTVRAFGDVLVATTSLREVVAYTDAGVRLWSVRTGELTVAGAVRVSDDAVAVATVDGIIRVLDLRTGAARWETSVGSDLSLAPVTVDGALVVADQQGVVTALELEDGTPRWTVDRPAATLTAVGPLLVLTADGLAEGFDATSGRLRWQRPVAGAVTASATYENRVVLATKSGSLVLDEDGRLLAREPAWLDLTVHGGYLIGWGPIEATVLGPELRTVTRWALTAQTVGSAGGTPLPYRQGLRLAGPVWTLEVWSDEP